MSVKTITKENFNDTVLQEKKPVLLDFWASWCGPCKMLTPIVHEIADETDKVVIGAVNVDEQPELAQQFRIVSIPTLVLMKDGEVADASVGFRPKEAVEAMLGI